MREAAIPEPRWLLPAIGVAALLVGGAMWWLFRPLADDVSVGSVDIAPPALYAATFSGSDSRLHALGEFQGKTLVVNFWATWCVPCREEMPAFSRLQTQWASRDVRFVGLANDDPGQVARFGRQLGISYPLWTGGEEVGELSRRLGNHLKVLPHTVIIDATGRVVESKVGPYGESDLSEKLSLIAVK